MTHVRQIPILLANLVLLSGCNVGPKYARPLTAPMSQFSLAPDAGVTDGKPTTDAWWDSFRDPELSSLIQRAVAANHDLKQAAERVNQARSSVRGARSELFPQVNTNVSAARERVRVVAAQSRTNFAIVPVEISNFQGTFDASGEIDAFGRVRREVQAAQSDLHAADDDRRAVLVTLLADVGRYYSDLRGSQSRLEITKKNIEIEKDTVSLTSVRSAAGLATEFDVARAQAQLEITQAEVPTISSTIQTDIHRLGVLLGLAPNSLEFELLTSAALPPLPPAIPVGLPSDLLERRPDIRRSEQQIAAQVARVGQAKAEYFPRFSLTGSAGRAASQLHDLTLGAGNVFSVGPTISLPVFTAGRIRANVDQQNSLAAEATARYQANILTAFEETENALTNYANEQDRHKRLQASSVNQETALKLAQVQYEAGLTDFLTVLDAERQLYTTQDQVALSSTAVVVDAVAVYKALGGGWQAVDAMPHPRNP